MQRDVLESRLTRLVARLKWAPMRSSATLRLAQLDPLSARRYCHGENSERGHLMTTNSLRMDLAPTGKLRVGINYGNPVLAKKDSTSGDLHGVAVDLARELARRADVPVELIGFESAGKMFEAVKTGAWDIEFLA